MYTRKCCVVRKPNSNTKSKKRLRFSNSNSSIITLLQSEMILRFSILSKAIVAFFTSNFLPLMLGVILQ